MGSDPPPVLAAGWGVEAAKQQSVAAWRAAYAFDDAPPFSHELARARERVHRRLADLELRVSESAMQRAQVAEVADRFDRWLAAASDALAGEQTGATPTTVALNTQRCCRASSTRSSPRRTWASAPGWA